jgi:hypothetical protein
MEYFLFELLLVCTDHEGPEAEPHWEELLPHFSKPGIVPISLILSIGKFFTSIQLSSCNHKTLITQRSKASETGPD